MNKFLQILCYAVLFLLVLAIGNFFEFITEDIRITLQDDLPGKPLPTTTTFILDNHLAISYVFLFPWLFFIGLPLLPFIRESYWDTTQFLLRFSAFVSVESLLLFVFFFFYCAPFIPVLQGMAEGGGPPLTLVESSVRGIFWISVLVLVIAAAWRIFRSRNK